MPFGQFQLNGKIAKDGSAATCIQGIGIRKDPTIDEKI